MFSACTQINLFFLFTTGYLSGKFVTLLGGRGVYFCFICYFVGLSLAPVVTLIPIVLLERFDKAVVSLALGIVYGVQGGGVITSYGVTGEGKIEGSLVIV